MSSQIVRKAGDSFYKLHKIRMNLEIKQTYLLEEALSIARLTWSLIFSNDVVEKAESIFFQELLNKLKLSQTCFSESLSKSLDEVYSVIRNMPAVKKQECATIFRMAVHSDGKVDLSELSGLNEILNQTEIFKSDKTNTPKHDVGF
jgi:hypothetical protein